MLTAYVLSVVSLVANLVPMVLAAATVDAVSSSSLCGGSGNSFRKSFDRSKSPIALSTYISHPGCPNGYTCNTWRWVWAPDFVTFWPEICGNSIIFD